MSNYFNLAPAIADKYDMNPGTIQVVLGLLDQFATEHPDQVPGRTIAESEFHEAADAHRNGGLGWQDLANDLGITVVPDPEPTNAEKLRTDIDAFYAQSVGELADGHGLEDFLSKRGWTKAPGGDDE